MTEPLVLCIMLANGRPAMCRRAIRSYNSQTYQRRHMIILDTGEQPAVEMDLFDEQTYSIVHFYKPQWRGKSIGALRNAAIEIGGLGEDLVAHWDSDDWSASERLADQVAYIRQDHHVAGYNSLTFWKEPAIGQPGEAWIYKSQSRDYCIGTSLMYWLSTWEARPFPDMPIKGDPRVNGAEELAWQLDMKRWSSPGTPFMIASVHSDNTLCKIAAGMEEWHRAPELDGWAAERMKL